MIFIVFLVIYGACIGVTFGGITHFDEDADEASRVLASLFWPIGAPAFACAIITRRLLETNKKDIR